MKSASILGALALGLSVLALQDAAFGAASDFELTLVETKINASDDTVISVLLIDRRTGAPVPDAVIFATRLDMEPEGMETMLAPVEALPSTEPGVYRFRTELSMQGGWQFSVALKVQGEAETVQMRSNFEAVQ